MALLDNQRCLFDIPAKIAYFNSAYNSPQLSESRRRLLLGAAEKSRPWLRRADDFFADADRLRELAAQLFGGDSDGYAIIPAASYGMSSAARAVEPHLCPEDRIVVVAEDFPSDILPWRRSAAESHATLIIVDRPADGDWTQALLKEIAHGARVVVAPTCHWTDGTAFDITAIASACKQSASHLVVNATQSLGALPFSVDVVQPDFLVSSGYKWLLSPYGFGLLYVSERWREARPLEESWLARDNARNFAGLVNYSDGYRPGARRFDVGETCVPTLLPGAIAAFEQLGEWGIANIATTLSQINQTIAKQLESIGLLLPPASQRSPHMFGARLPSRSPNELVSLLAQDNIFVSQRGDAIRIAPHLHVTMNDIERLIHRIHSILT